MAACSLRGAGLEGVAMSGGGPKPAGTPACPSHVFKGICRSQKHGREGGGRRWRRACGQMHGGAGWGQRHSNPAPAFATCMCTLFCVFFKRHK